MKTRFTTYDLFAVMHDLQSVVGMRLQNIYDIDSKTYLLRFQKPEHKATILMESGMRLHLTNFEWPKNTYPSSFSMKLRKHIKQKRLLSVRQLGIDRIVDFQFGEEEWACHVILELYDRGNIVLTDKDYLVLNILRPRTDKDTDVRFAVRQTYPVDQARNYEPLVSFERVKELLENAKPGDNLRKVLTPHFHFGPALLEHSFRSLGLPANGQIQKNIQTDDFGKVYSALEMADEVFLRARKEASGGVLITKTEEKKKMDSGEVEKLETYQEYHPMLFFQHSDGVRGEGLGVKDFESFTQAVDEFYSKKESQKLDLKALQQEREAMKKLDNIKKDHESRLKGLQETQEADRKKASLIEMNKEVVDRAILVIRSALANQHTWEDIRELVEEATDRGDPVASRIKALKLEINHITLELKNPYWVEGMEEEEGEEELENIRVDVDLNLGAYQNARKYYDFKKQAATKEQKTLDSSKKALKSAEQKALETLKQVQIRTSVNKQRKTFWFEKFLWFISSEDYLVIGGRDAQQNELLVKRYLRPGDVYVHADLRGAASVIVKNRAAGADVEIPPKTLNEAGAMAVCFSAAWEAKVVAGAWWVRHDQVSKTAPTGEYLTPGSFMIRGKKNFLPSAQLQMGFGFLFRLEEECLERHRGERRRTELSREASEMGEEEDAEILVESDEEKGEEVEEEKDYIQESSGNEDPDSQFPDVQVQLKHLRSHDSTEEEVTILHLGPKRPTDTNKGGGSTHERPGHPPGGGREETGKEREGEQAKRGQRHKQKKLKQKYRDQDEEERRMRMDILASAGDQKIKGKKNKKKAAAEAAKAERRQPRPKETHKEEEKDTQPEETNQPVVDESPDLTAETSHQQNSDSAKENPVPVQETQIVDEDDDPASEIQNEMTSALDSLTGTPFPDDLLVFAVPVCGPYSTMSNYKFKVKLTPGTGKKGKAIKTAVQMFVNDKETGAREKDLLRAVLDQDMSRNIPGKVKVSAPQLMAHRQKMQKAK